MITAPTFADVYKVLPLLLILAASLFPLTIKIMNRNREQGNFVTLFQALLGIGIALFFVFQGRIGDTAFSNAVIQDGLALWTVVLVLGLAAFTLVFSHGNHATRGAQFSEHVFLVLSSVMGIMVIAWSNDLVLTFIGIELMSLAFYVLAGLSLEQRFSKEAAFKYFILGSFGSAFFLYGVALVYGITGTTAISGIINGGATLFINDAIFATGIVLILSGLLFKVSVFPFHAWAPDVYQGSPSPVTAFMSTAGKLAGFVILIRVLGSHVLSSSVTAIDVLEWLAVITMLVGNIMAIRQENFKRMLAYSSVAHSGYALVGVIALAMGGAGSTGASAVLFYFVGYGAMSIGAFAILNLFEKNENTLVLVDDLKGFAKRSPWLAAGLTLCLVSLAGIPPTIGFFGKLYIFSSAMKQGLLWLTVWGVINSVISVYYYLRPVLNMYMKEPENGVYPTPQRDVLTKSALFVASIGVIVMGIMADPIISKFAFSIAQLFE